MAALGRELAPARVEWISGTALPEEDFDLVTLVLRAERAPDPAATDRTRLARRPPGARRRRSPHARRLPARPRGARPPDRRRPHVAAPCPHERDCPLAGTADWCHFAVRVARSSAHRQAKGRPARARGREVLLRRRHPASPRNRCRLASSAIRSSAQVMSSSTSAPGTNDAARPSRSAKAHATKAARKVSWGEAWRHDCPVEEIRALAHDLDGWRKLVVDASPPHRSTEPRPRREARRRRPHRDRRGRRLARAARHHARRGDPREPAREERDVHARRTKKGRWLVSSAVRRRPRRSITPTTASAPIRCPRTIRCSPRRRSPATSTGRCSTTSSSCARCRSGTGRRSASSTPVREGVHESARSSRTAASAARASSSSGSTPMRT